LLQDRDKQPDRLGLHLGALASRRLFSGEAFEIRENCLNAHIASYLVDEWFYVDPVAAKSGSTPSLVKRFIERAGPHADRNQFVTISYRLDLATVSSALYFAGSAH
jgi:hypothetical protein